MKNHFVLMVAWLCATTSLFAQNQITGTIYNHQHEGLYFATVALYQNSDSAFVKGTSTNESGQFELENLKDGSYFLEVSMLGFKNGKVENLNLPSDNSKIITLSLMEDAATLSTVEVTAKVPLLEQKADRMVVNVADNITSLNGSLLDVMKKVPGMLVVGDKLRMAGQPNITILLNGKSTKYMNIQSLLKDIPGDNIQRVEVIHQPGAEFDAEGSGPIINIVLKKNRLFGTNGHINVGAAKGEDWKYRTSLTLSHYQGDLNIYGRVGYKDYPYYDEMRLTRKVGEDVYDQVSIDPYANKSFDTNLGLDWDISNRHRVGFTGRYQDWASKNLIVNTTDINFIDDANDDLLLVTENQKDETWKLATFNPYYRFEIDTAGHQIDFDVNLVRIKNGGGNTLSSEEMNFGLYFPGQQYLQPGESKIITTQLDYTYPFSNDLKLQFGVKYSDANLDNNLMASEANEFGEWIDNPQQSNHYIFDETIKAAYTKLSFNKEKWSGTVGLRYEDSQSQGYSVTLDSTLNRDIAQLFPSASLSRAITKDIGTTLSYSYRIERPSYSSLNPFVYFLDPFTFEKGNPALLPAFTHNMKLSLTYEKQPFFNVEYKITEDAMMEMTAQDDATGETSLSAVNLESFKNLNISLFFPLDFIPKISGYGGVIANYGKYDSEYLNDNFLRSKWDFTGFLQASFKLPGEINSEVTGWYNSGGQEGIISADWIYGVDIGFSRKFLDDKLKISAGVENLMARYLRAEIRYANMDIDLYNRWDGPVINMQLVYKFGNQHFKQKQGRRSSAAEELNRAAKN